MPIEADPFERAASAVPPRPEIHSFQKMDVDTEMQRHASFMQRKVEEEMAFKRNVMMAVACVLLVVGVTGLIKHPTSPPLRKASPPELRQHHAASISQPPAASSQPRQQNSENEVTAKPGPSYHFPASYAEVRCSN